MSQLPATHPATRPVRRRPSTRGPLRVVRGGAVARRGGFPAVCVGLLVGGLLTVLLLNAALAQGSFELGRLQATSSALADRQEALTESIDEQRAPANLARRAGRLGMVPAQSAAFLRLTDGKVLGVARPAEKDSTFTVVTSTPSVPTSPGSGSPSSTDRASAPPATTSRQDSATTNQATTDQKKKPSGGQNSGN